MNIETIIIIITLFFAANTYYDGNLLKDFSKYKKYYKVAGCLFVGLSFYAMIKKNPDQSRNLVQSASEFIKILPVDRSAKDMITPLLDMSTPMNMYNNNSSPQFKRMVNSGQSTKRSVSETKKKYVASSQDWKCFKCRMKLPAWFEVDHKIRLDRGGTNEVDNLVAYCRNCHGEKTAMENL